MQSDTTGSLQEFHKILEEAGKKGASDIHYVPKEQLLLRIDGRLVDMTEEWNVSFSMEELIEELLDKKQQKTFEENGEVEFSCPVFNRRVRVNLFRQSGTCAMSVRLFAEKIPTPQMLGLPESAVQMAGKRRGLILVTGASGSGRTTTMASMIDHIASNYERSILTLEKPAEYLFRSGKSMVLQREIGIDSRSYEAGLKAALKQDMDVILISEMEDLDTVSLALTAAEMGHLCDCRTSDPKCGDFHRTDRGMFPGSQAASDLFTAFGCTGRRYFPAASSETGWRRTCGGV